MTIAGKADLLERKSGTEHAICTAPEKKSNFLVRFFRSESGSYTIESVIWLPIYVFILALMMNVSMVFFNESQLLRVVQDGNRSFAVGRITTLDAVERYCDRTHAFQDATQVLLWHKHRHFSSANGGVLIHGA